MARPRSVVVGGRAPREVHNLLEATQIVWEREALAAQGPPGMMAEVGAGFMGALLVVLQVVAVEVDIPQEVILLCRREFSSVPLPPPCSLLCRQH